MDINGDPQEMGSGCLRSQDFGHDSGPTTNSSRGLVSGSDLNDSSLLSIENQEERRDQTQQTVMSNSSQMSTTVFDQHQESSQDEKTGEENSPMHLLDSTLTKDSFMRDGFGDTHMQVEGSDKQKNPGVKASEEVTTGSDVEANDQNASSNVNVIDQLPTPRDQEPKASSTMIQRTQIGDDVTVIDDDDDDEEITVISMVSSATMHQGKSQMQELEMQKVEAEKAASKETLGAHNSKQ